MSNALSCLSVRPYLSRFLELLYYVPKSCNNDVFHVTFTETGESVTQLTTQTHQNILFISQLMKADEKTPTQHSNIPDKTDVTYTQSLTQNIIT